MNEAAAPAPIPVIRTAEDLRNLDFTRPVFTEARLLRDLVESHVVSPDSIRELVDYRRKHQTDLLEAVEKLGIIDAAQRPMLVAQKLGIPVVHIEGLTVDPVVLGRVPPEIAVRHRVFPLARANGTLIVAIANPADKEAIAAATFAVGHRIEVVVVPDEDITKLIDTHFLSAEEQNLITELGEDTTIPHATVRDEAPVDVEQRARQAPIVRLVDAVIRRAIRMRTSDINIRPLEHGGAIYYRIDGEMMWQRNLPTDLLAPIVCRIKIMSGMNIAEHRLPQDGHASVLEGGQMYDLRISAIPVVTGESVVIRILNRNAANVKLEQLGIGGTDRERMARILDHTYGIFLVTGPTGSGKSTTLYAVINKRLEANPHVITVEDPVEYRMENVEQIQIKPQIGYTFAVALRHILRHDPDEILIGEMRDFETCEIAVKAALTGHFVMSTLHTNDAASAITRLQDMGLEPYLISSSVVGIMAQRLARRICPKCKAPDAGTAELREFFSLDPGESFFKGSGCPNCNGTGYRGRAMVGELIEVTPRLRELIDRKASADELRRVAVEEGMVPLTQNALALAREGITTLEEAFAVKLEG
ncbi:MAG: GspE/PulE family protein [Gammaproteobacteria bacterium]